LFFGVLSPNSLLKKERRLRSVERNYIVLMPLGDVLKEKIFEMGLDVTELITRCQFSVETIRGILDATTEMTQIIAKSWSV